MKYFSMDLRGIPRSNIQGVSNVFSAINKRLATIEGATLGGLLKAAAVIHNETEQGEVKTPIDLGNLRHSWFIVTSKASIQAGGGVSRTPSGASGGFTGPHAGKMVAQHSALIIEMKTKAEQLAKMNDGPFLIMGYSVDYAMWVHEMVGANFKTPGTDAKWFQSALYKHQDNIIDIVRNNARII